MSDSPQIWDPGLQPERTSLAWRRLSLALLGLAIIVFKVLYTLQVWGLVASATLLFTAAFAGLAGYHRFRITYTALIAGRHSPANGEVILVITSITLLAGIVGLVGTVSSIASLS